jgi:hypothetical protein
VEARRDARDGARLRPPDARERGPPRCSTVICSRRDEAARAAEFGSDIEDEESARAIVEPLLASWAATIELDHHVPLRFRFTGSRVRKGGDEEGDATHRVTREVATAWEVSRADARLESLPTPVAFVESPDLRLIRERLRQYRLGRHPLLVLGYHAYTIFTGRFGGRRNAPTAMNVDGAIFETLNDLTSNRSSPQHERKALRNKPRLSDAERAWVESAIVALVKQAGAIDAGAQPKRLTMGDLPPLI